LARVVFFYNAADGTVHRYIAKPLTMRDNIEIGRYKNDLAERNKADEIDDEWMLGMANYPLVAHASQSYHVISGYDEAPPEEVLRDADWGSPVEITEDVFLEMAEPFLFGVLEAIYDLNPDRKFEFDLLKKIMQSVKDLPIQMQSDENGNMPTSEIGSAAS